MQKMLLFILSAIAVSIVAACGDYEEPLLYLTEEELTVYNGEDGMPAYIAVDGFIYDVTTASNWIDGESEEDYYGKDITDEFDTLVPEGEAFLDTVPIVGEIIELNNDNDNNDNDDPTNGDPDDSENGDNDGDLEF